jgi:hypothetical protein
MSLDNTSHPGRPGADELVPSRCALRVGEIDVLVVSDGVLSLPGATLATNSDPASRATWLDDMFLPSDVLNWPLNVAGCSACLRQRAGKPISKCRSICFLGNRT